MEADFINSVSPRPLTIIDFDSLFMVKTYNS